MFYEYITPRVSRYSSVVYVLINQSRQNLLEVQISERPITFDLRREFLFLIKMPL